MSSLSPIQRAVRIAGSQTLLAEMIGRSQNWVSRVKAGKIASISVEDAFRIERATGGAVKAEEFAGLNPTPETEAAPDSPVAASRQSGSPANRVPAERRSPAGGVSQRGAA